MQINDSLVNAHLEAIPGLTALTARCFAGGDPQHFGRPTDWALSKEKLIHLTLPHQANLLRDYLHSKLLLLGAIYQIGTDFLQRPDVC